MAIHCRAVKNSLRGTIIIAKMQHLQKRKELHIDSIVKATTAAAIATDVATATDAKPQKTALVTKTATAELK
jgi:hypothetical protein